MPSDTSPVVPRRHSAMSNLRARAAIIVLRVLPRASAVRPMRRAECARSPLSPPARYRGDQAPATDEIAMPEIIFGILLLALGLWAINAFTSIDPRKLAPIIKFAGGFGALGGAAFQIGRASCRERV